MNGIKEHFVRHSSKNRPLTSSKLFKLERKTKKTKKKEKKERKKEKLKINCRSSLTGFKPVEEGSANEIAFVGAKIKQL
jgi:hypothetical protein